MRAQRSIPPRTDLREMLRDHIVRRSLACMEAAAARRQQATATPVALAAYCARIQGAVRGFYGNLPAGPEVQPPTATLVSTFSYDGYRAENVLFETYPGWQVNATVYVPADCLPPFPVVVVPVGHSGKQFANYQLPCQYFARAGYLAICFDPPGQASEKQPGNDHFTDGVRDYLIGCTSSRYFVSDAIRCIDYAAVRPDADLSAGVAMTGVSGGGTTTTLAALLDDRIAVTGPCCCVTPLADLDIDQCYAGCPETHPFGRYAAGVDEVDLLCAAAPLPCLLMAGETDEVFRIADTRRLAECTAGFYAAAGASERFDLRVDPDGHAYPLPQARAFARWMNRWLRGDPERRVPDLPDPAIGMRPVEELRCSPRTDVNMRTLATAAADTLARTRDRSPRTVRRQAAAIAGVSHPADMMTDAAAGADAAAATVTDTAPSVMGRAACGRTAGTVGEGACDSAAGAPRRTEATPTGGCEAATAAPVPAAETGAPFQVWTHDWRAVMLRPETDIELPATLLTPRTGAPAPAILHLDDAGRHRSLYRHGPLARAIRFLDRDRPGVNLLTVDLRGWGDTAPAMYPYEMAGWGSLERYSAYATAALGDPVMSMRIRDALAALAWLRTRPEVDGARIRLAGRGLGGLVALHAAAIDHRLAGVIVWDGLSSWRSLIAADSYPWTADAFMPNVLLHYDLPDLAAAIPAPVRVHNLLDGSGAAADAAELALWSAAANVTVAQSVESAFVAEVV